MRSYQRDCTMQVMPENWCFSNSDSKKAIKDRHLPFFPQVILDVWEIRK